MRLVSFVKQVFQGFGKDKIGQLSAAFAYGAIFSIGPLLLVLVSVVGLVYGPEAAQGKLFSQLSETFGPDTAKTIQDVIANTYKAGKGQVALVLGIIGMLLGAAGITAQLQNAFNAILGVVPDPKGGIKRTLLVKVKNISVVLLAGIIIAASLVISALAAGLGSKVQQEIGAPAITIEIFNNLISFAVLASLLYFMYRVVPDVLVPRKIVIVASLLVTVLFVIGKVILGIIIGNNGTASAYGAAATLISLLLWIYYLGQILFIGAEGMKVYGFNNSVEYKPKKNNLKRTTVHIDGNSPQSRLAEAWLRGFRKASGKNKKKK